MSEDYSLDDFVAAGDREDEHREDGDHGEVGAGNDSLDDVEPASATARWAAEMECPDCGTTEGRLWRDGDQFVCTGCKEW